MPKCEKKLALRLSADCVYGVIASEYREGNYNGAMTKFPFS